MNVTVRPRRPDSGRERSGLLRGTRGEFPARPLWRVVDLDAGVAQPPADGVRRLPVLDLASSSAQLEQLIHERGQRLTRVAEATFGGFSQPDDQRAQKAAHPAEVSGLAGVA